MMFLKNLVCEKLIDALLLKNVMKTCGPIGDECLRKKRIEFRLE